MAKSSFSLLLFLANSAILDGYSISRIKGKSYPSSPAIVAAAMLFPLPCDNIAIPTKMSNT